MGNLILYFTLGYPENQTLLSFIDEIGNGSVSYIEFGFPSPNPKYDGPIIRRTHAAARLNYALEEYEKIFSKSLEKANKIYSLSYYSDIRGEIEQFIVYLKNQGFSGIILPDLLIDYFHESKKIINCIQANGLDFIPFFTPSSPDSNIIEISKMTKSWIYYGLQPSTGISVPYDLDEVTERIKELLPEREINFGFGIRNVDQIAGLIERGASGVAIGSLFVRMLEEGNRHTFHEFLEKAGGVLNE